jgi:hypothetical protein
MIIGNAGSTGHFFQTGGVYTKTGAMVVGGSPGGSGEYDISAGVLNDPDIQIGGGGGAGTFSHSGSGIVNSQAVSVNAGGSYQLEGGTLNVGSLTVASGGAFNFTGGTLNFTNSPPVLTLFGALGMSLDLSPSKTLRISGNSLSFRVNTDGIFTFSGGTLDLTDKKLVVSNSNVTPLGTWDGTAYTGLTGQIASGRNGDDAPLWDGPGIVTSQTIAAGSNFHSIGIASGIEVLISRGLTATSMMLWGGQTITGSDTLVMYTYGGDANLDGKINIDDYVRIDQGIAGGLTGWSNGDFNYDGKINIDDYTTVIDSNIANRGLPFATASGGQTLTVVPEPAGALLYGICAAALATAARRRRSAS